MKNAPQIILRPKFIRNKYTISVEEGLNTFSLRPWMKHPKFPVQYPIKILQKKSTSSKKDNADFSSY
jgi:hypothetical protein|nr:hypothetical protein [Bacilli bacterium]